MEDNVVNKLINSDNVLRVSTFVKQMLDSQHHKDDYKELLKLNLIYLGCLTPDKVSFNTPGAYHYVRFMAKAIYSFKIFIFRDQYKLTNEERAAVRYTTIFIVLHYVETWFTSPAAPKAPNHDLQFLIKLHDYRLKMIKYQMLYYKSIEIIYSISTQMLQDWLSLMKVYRWIPNEKWYST